MINGIEAYLVIFIINESLKSRLLQKFEVLSYFIARNIISYIYCDKRYTSKRVAMATKSQNSSIIA